MSGYAARAIVDVGEAGAEAAAAALLLSSALAHPCAAAAAGSPAGPRSNGSGGTGSPLSEDASDGMEDDQMQSLDGQPHSGSVSTLEPGDWPTNEAAADIQGSSHLLPQQLVHLAQHAAQQQQQPGAHEFTMAQQIAAQQLRGRRNARQQEQNKQVRRAWVWQSRFAFPAGNAS